MKKIYFACSIRGGRNDAVLYKNLVDFLKTECIVLTELFADGNLTSSGMNKPDELIHATDIAWINEADAVIAEVTSPSLGVGYEIGKAEELGKPVLALYRSVDGKKLSAMIAGSSQTNTVYYEDLEDVIPEIRNFLNQI